MEQDRFASCLAEVLRHEGGYVDDPRDPGGATNLGLTLASYSEALGRTASTAELRALTAQSAAPIYRRLYWRAAGCHDLPAGLDLMVFDAAVNMGVGEARRLLRQSGRGSAAVLIRRIAEARADRYRGLETFPVFGAGWLRRLEAVTARALQDAAAKAPQAGQQGGAA